MESNFLPGQRVAVNAAMRGRKAGGRGVQRLPGRGAAGRMIMWVLLLFLMALGGILLRGERAGLPLGDWLGLGMVQLYARLWHGLSCNGPSPFPRKGPAILVANHTCSADAAFLTTGCAPRVLSFLIAGEYYAIPLLGRLLRYMGCVPVRRDGGDVAAVRAGLRRLSEGRILCIFPEGGLSNAGRGRHRAGKAGAALLALRSRVPVVPVRISGGPQTADIGQAWLRPSRARVTFGRPVDLSAYYGRPINRKLLEEVTGLLMKQVADLSFEPEPLLRSVAKRETIIQGGHHDNYHRFGK